MLLAWPQEAHGMVLCLLMMQNFRYKKMPNYDRIVKEAATLAHLKMKPIDIPNMSKKQT